jgi:hypothetical protein
MNETQTRGRRVAQHIRHHMVGYIALFVALMMTPVPSYAAGLLVGTKQIKDGAVTTEKLHKSAVTAKKIKQSSVTSGKIKAGAVGTGKLKDASVTSAKLSADAQGFTTIVVRKQTVSVANASAGAVTTDCQAGETATGGGGLLLGAFTDPVYIRSYPSAQGSETSLADGDVPLAWTTRIYNNTGGAADLQGFVVCASK